jgi:hypothetical protein
VLKVAYRVGVDLDGVLADLDAAVELVAGRLFAAESPDMPVGDDILESPTAETTVDPAPGETHSGSIRHERLIWHDICATENFWETLDEIEPGAVARLSALATDHRWEIVFLTKRPSTAGDTTQLQSQRWLARHGFALPSVCVVSGSRGKVADALDLDALIDDRPENCLDVVTDSKAKAILIWRGDRTHVAPNARRLGIEVADSFAACLELLVVGQRAAGPPGGLVDRVRRWFDAS